MKKQVFIRFLIFFILFAGAVEAKPAVDKNTDDKITVSGLYNPFANTSCSTIDKYQQGSVKVNYDKRINKNLEFHSSALYSRSTRTYHKYNPDSEHEDEKPLPLLKNSGYMDLGISFWWEYIRIRVDFNLILWDNYDENNNTEITPFPMGGLMIEAGKMDTFWVSIGCLHPEYPYGMAQLALNQKIKDVVELGIGTTIISINHSTWNPDGTYYPSIFIRTKIKLHDFFGLNAYFNLKPYFYKEPDQMFEGSLGMEFRF